MSDPTHPTQPAKIETGVPGLDQILLGGLSPSGVFIVEGPPGAGKTILTNQICFHRARRDETSLYITLLAESHDVLLQHLSSMSFFDEKLIPNHLYYLSAFDVLAREGLPGILALLRTSTKEHKASMIVLDGLFVLEESINSDREFRKFINDLNALAKLMNTTILLLTNSSRKKPGVHPEHTMVDGWMELDHHLVDYRLSRSLVVYKYRGSAFLEGRHLMRITDDGVVVLPRLERLHGGTGRSGPPPGGRLSSGVPGLDELMRGGIRTCSSTLVLGPTGVGKTLFGLQFVAVCTPQEPGLILSFHEDETQLKAKAAGLGLCLEEKLADGSVEVLWTTTSEESLDEIGYRLLDNVRRRGVRRLFVDGVDDFEEAAQPAHRLRPFLIALWRELKQLGVTAVYAESLPEVMGGEPVIGPATVSAFAENIVTLRYRETNFCLQRTLGVLKMRDSDFDPRVRPYTIGQGGFALGEPFVKEGC